MGDVRLVFVGIQTHLEKYAKDNSFMQSTMADLIFHKINEYWMIMDSASTTSAILDPRNKDSVFPDELKSEARVQVQSIYELYKERSFSSANLTPVTPKRRNRQYFASLRKNITSTISTPVELEVETELDRYLEQQIDEEAEPLLWWQVHSNEFPILSKMARDYLTIQATSVASEQAFSIAGNVITKTRNRLLPETARACLCVKSWIDNNLIE